MKSSLAAALGSALLLAAGMSVGHAATPPATKANVAATRPAPAMDMMHMMMQTMVDQRELTAGSQGNAVSPKP